MKRHLDFVVPAELQASAPPEVRGRGRDAVRMMVAYRDSAELVSSDFDKLGLFVGAGDLLVVNASATLPAALVATETESGAEVVVHLSARLSVEPAGAEVWALELRRPSGAASKAWDGAAPEPKALKLGDGTGRLDLIGPYRASRRLRTGRLAVSSPVLTWLSGNGRPIRYGYVERPWPLSAYQTMFATEPGSAEMPSAGRPFTPEVVAHLLALGARFAPIVLHTGVSTTEVDEVPAPERFRVPSCTASKVNATRQAGGRVIAVGTTAVRALESAFDPAAGRVSASAGWTELVVTPERGVNVVDGLLTGWHEPEASHLLMLEAIAGRQLLEATYAAGIAQGYLWHEFGDVALILP
jgi:S-adenosylmethionine:tRNA ribosyltransferase-isomerase